VVEDVRAQKLMLKVLLCQPPLHIGTNVFLPEEVSNRLSCFPSLGLLSVRAGLKQKAGIDAEYLDAEALLLDIPATADRIARAAPDIVGLSMDSFTLPITHRLACEIKRRLPEVIVAAGGVHPTIYPERTAALSCIDWAFCGEADYSFADAAVAWKERGEPDVKGVAYSREGQIVFTGSPDPLDDLDSLPMPDRSGIPLDEYFSAPAKSRPVLSLITSRGCPFSCTFCDRPILSNRFRMRSADLVVQEVMELKELGAKELSFYDDNFTVNKKRVRSIADSLAEHGAPIPFDMRSRVDTVDAELIELLAAAGCRRIYFGVESGDPEVLDRISKGINLDQAKSIFSKAKQHGIRRLAYFMFGLPGENEEAARRTVAFAETLDADFYLFEAFIPMPATQAYDEAVRSGLYQVDHWAAQAENPDPAFVPPTYPGEMTSEQVEQVMREAYRRTMMTPGFLLRSLLDIRSLRELITKVKAGLGFFRMQSR